MVIVATTPVDTTELFLAVSSIINGLWLHRAVYCGTLVQPSKRAYFSKCVLISDMSSGWFDINLTRRSVQSKQ